MLNWKQANGRHTILDDMDSLVHVITYCALLFLPHKLNPEGLAGSVISACFQHSVENHPGARHGGSEKLGNILSRYLLTKAGFQSELLVEWLNSVLDLEMPAFGQFDKFGDKFTPDEFDNYWTTFLRTHSLPNNDRVVNRLSRLYEYDHIVPTSDSTMPSTVSSLGKRSSQEEDASGEHPDSKRRRSMRLRGQRAGGILLGPTPARSLATGGLRRSQRIQSRVDALPVANPATLSSERQPPSKQRLPAKRHAGARPRSN
ncbi:hypothetical protein C8Q79DRAFT_207559 [Trametes meyenii]|nr:hypothetical protein C8Q79DRAFT_207559 [Trametes meyenii]